MITEAKQHNKKITRLYNILSFTDYNDKDKKELIRTKILEELQTTLKILLKINPANTEITEHINQLKRNGYDICTIIEARNTIYTIIGE